MVRPRLDASRPMTAKERKERHKQKIKANPELLEKQRKAERERWKKRVSEKKIIVIGDCSRRERKYRKKSGQRRRTGVGKDAGCLTM